MLIMKPWITTKMSRLRVAGWNIERPVSPSELRRVQGPQAKTGSAKRSRQYRVTLYLLTLTSYSMLQWGQRMSTLPSPHIVIQYALFRFGVHYASASALHGLVSACDVSWACIAFDGCIGSTIHTPLIECKLRAQALRTSRRKRGT